MSKLADRKRLSSEDDENGDFVDRKKKGKTKHAISSSGSFIFDLSQSDRQPTAPESIIDIQAKASQGAVDGNSSPILYASDEDSEATRLLSQPVSQKTTANKASRSTKSAGSADESNPHWPCRTNGDTISKKKVLGAAFSVASMAEFDAAQRLTQHKEDVLSSPPQHEEVSLSPSTNHQPVAAATSSSVTFCPVCSLNISTVSQAYRERHVNDCMELSEALAHQKKQNQKKTAAPAVSAQERDDDRESHNLVVSQQQPQSAAPEKFTCELCGKDLTALDLPKRQLHLNECCDEYQSQSVQKLSQKQGSPVPPPAPQSITDSTYVCQICQKEISRCSLKARVSHLKSCAKKNGVQPDRMPGNGTRTALAAKAAAKPPAASTGSTAAAAAAAAASSSSAVVRSRFFTELQVPVVPAAPVVQQTKKKPRSRKKAAREEEQLQVALAISASLTEHQQQQQQQQRQRQTPSRKDIDIEFDSDSLSSHHPHRQQHQHPPTTSTSAKRPLAAASSSSLSRKSRDVEEEANQEEDEDQEAEEVSCTPALAPSGLAKKYAATRSAAGSGGLWQTAARADLSSPSRMYVTGLLANVVPPPPSINIDADPQLQQLNQALRTDSIRTPVSTTSSITMNHNSSISPRSPLFRNDSIPPAPVPLIPQPGSESISAATSGTVAQRVQHILDTYASQCAEKRRVLEEKQRELKSWYLSEIGRLTLEKDDHLAALREETAAADVDAAAAQLQLRVPLLPPLPPADLPGRLAAVETSNAAAPSTALPPVAASSFSATGSATAASSATAVAPSPAIATAVTATSTAASVTVPVPPVASSAQPALILAATKSEPSIPNAPPQSSSNAIVATATPPVAPATPITAVPSIPVVVIPPMPTALSQPRANALPKQPAVKPPPPLTTSASAPVPSSKPPLVPPVKPVSLVAKPAPPTVKPQPAVKPPAAVTKPASSSSVVIPPPSAPPRPIIIDIISPPPPLPEIRSHSTTAVEDDELCDAVPNSPTRPAQPPVLFETNHEELLDDYTPEEMQQILRYLDEQGDRPPPSSVAAAGTTESDSAPQPAAAPCTPPPHPPASSFMSPATAAAAVESPGLNDSILQPVLKNVPLLISSSSSSHVTSHSHKAPEASSRAQADSVLLLTPPAAEEVQNDSDSEEMNQPFAVASAGSKEAEARALLRSNPKPLDEWSIDEMKVALEKLGATTGSRQFMRYKITQLAGLDVIGSSAVASANSSGSALSSSAPAAASAISSAVSSAKPKARKEKACSDVDMDMKITQLIKTSALYEQMLQYERVELADLQDYLKTNGLKVSKKIISGFCSSKGVLYRNTKKRKKAPGASRSENDK